jgi:uncharacterized protein (DUF488 family)
MKYFTIGYGGRGKGEFLELLRGKGIRSIVDVRLRPDRASLGYAALSKDPAKGIQGMLSAEGIEYVSLVELGNLFKGCEDWKERYAKLARAIGPLILERLLDSKLPPPICLLCAEKHARDCHRSSIAEELVKLGHEVEHME